ncbi:MAG: low affinity iron permease family protein [Pyrinomonadaceae bacterium]|nr:low affinity iron permease family protein [Pyrinomonadaceae bacterium]
MNRHSDTFDHFFGRVATFMSDIIGSMRAVLVTALLIFGSGYVFDFSTAWRDNSYFVIGVATLFFLFFLQKSQNVTSKATHLKLDELIRAIDGARSKFADTELKSENDIDRMKQLIREEHAEDDETANQIS